MAATRPRSLRSLLLLAVAPVLLAACGTTVPVTTTVSQGGTTGGAVVPTQVLHDPGAPTQVPTGGGTTTGSSSTSSTSGGSTTTGTSDPSEGSTKTTTGSPSSPNVGALQIGIAYVDNGGSSAALGFSASNTVTAKKASEGLVRGFNRAGGLASRRLVAVEYAFDGQGSNYATAASAACAKFTQDNHVSVVLDSAFGNIGGFRQCMQKAGVMVIATQDEGDEAASRSAPLHVNTSMLTGERAYSAVLRTMVSTGYLTNKNQLGVVIEDCPENTTPYTETLVPLIAQLGLKKAQTYKISCTTGFASAGPAASALSSAVLAFRSAGVDRVMFVSSANESVALYLFGPVASSQKYTPGYLLTSSAQAQAIRSSIPKDQWPQLNGVGNSPVLDVDGARPSAEDTRCRNVAAVGGTVYSTYQDGDFIYLNCGPFLLLEAALKVTNGSADPHDLVSAIASLGGSFKAPGVIDSSTFFSPTRRDGPAKVQVFGYVAGCTCMRYSGAPISLIAGGPT